MKGMVFSMKKWGSLLLVATMLLTSTACGTVKPVTSENQQQEVSATKVFAVKPTVTQIEKSSEFIANVEASESIDVVANISEEVTKVYKNVGERVNKGDLLFELNNENLINKLEEEEANYESSKATVQQMLGSNKDTSIDMANQGYSSMKNGIKVMEKNLESLDKQLDNLKKQIKSAEEQEKIAKDNYNNILSANAADETNENVVKAKAQFMNAQERKEELLQGKYGLEKSYDDLDDTYHDQKDSLYEQKDLSSQMRELAEKDAVKDMKKLADAIIKISDLTLNNAKTALEDTKVYSPISGVVDKKFVEENNMISQNSTAYTITNNSIAKISFKLSGNYIPFIKKGDSILIKTKTENMTATISEIPNMIDQKTGLFKVIATVNNSKGDLIVGSCVKVEIPTIKKSNVITIPLKCVYFQDDYVYTYVIKDGKAVEQPIQIGIYNNEEIEIIDGINKDDSVISSWTSLLRNGLPVKAEDEKIYIENNQSVQQTSQSTQQGEVN